MSDPETPRRQNGVVDSTEDIWSDVDESLLALCDHLGVVHPTCVVFVDVMFISVSDGMGVALITKTKVKSSAQHETKL